MLQRYMYELLVTSYLSIHMHFFLKFEAVNPLDKLGWCLNVKKCGVCASLFSDWQYVGHAIRPQVLLCLVWCSVHVLGRSTMQSLLKTHAFKLLHLSIWSPLARGLWALILSQRVDMKTAPWPRPVSHRTNPHSRAFFCYRKEGYLAAHCGLKSHGKYCRINRTMKAGRNPDQGRPFGLELAWLKCAEDFATSALHKEIVYFPHILTEDTSAFVLMVMRRTEARAPLIPSIQIIIWISCRYLLKSIHAMYLHRYQ